MYLRIKKLLRRHLKNIWVAVVTYKPCARRSFWNDSHFISMIIRTENNRFIYTWFKLLMFSRIGCSLLRICDRYFYISNGNKSTMVTTTVCTWTFIAAPTTKPTLCATKEMSRQDPRNIEKRNQTSGCDVSKYTITT